jgi:hypothetical protein
MHGEMKICKEKNSRKCATIKTAHSTSSPNVENTLSRFYHYSIILMYRTIDISSNKKTMSHYAKCLK